MPEWWTYGLSDFLMFSPRTWYRMLELHNQSWWPLHIFLLLCGVGVLWSMRSDAPLAARTGLVLVGLANLFVAWAFHWMRYADINWGARYFAIAFAAQGVLLLGLGFANRKLGLARSGASARAGVCLLLIALAYPMLAPVWGRPLAQSECFGLAPDPTALAALGAVLWLRDLPGPRHPRAARLLFMLLPFLWCAVAGATLWTLRAPDWFLMPMGGFVALVFAWRE